MLKINIQLFGGRGSSSGGFGGGGGGLTSADILATTSFVSERGNYKDTVDEALGVFSDVKDKYGFIINDIEMATIKDGKSAIAYYDGSNIGWNEKFMNKQTLENSYAECVKQGFHPSKGNKTAVQAVASHELGHALSAEVGRKMGGKGIDQASAQILKEAKKQTGHKKSIDVAKKISGYATHSPAETIAEAFSDVYCNGKKAHKESIAIVNVMDKYLLN